MIKEAFENLKPGDILENIHIEGWYAIVLDQPRESLEYIHIREQDSDKIESVHISKMNYTTVDEIKIPWRYFLVCTCGSSPENYSTYYTDLVIALDELQAKQKYINHQNSHNNPTTLSDFDNESKFEIVEVTPL